MSQSDRVGALWRVVPFYLPFDRPGPVGPHVERRIREARPLERSDLERRVRRRDVLRHGTLLGPRVGRQKARDRDDQEHGEQSRQCAFQESDHHGTRLFRYVSPIV